MSKRAGWWFRATHEQRMAQLDAAISLGMTARQLAMNCGGTVGAVAQFASVNGRKFRGYSAAKDLSLARGRASVIRHHNVAKLKAAYLAGEPVEVWGVE